jgi:hypothetical protein
MEYEILEFEVTKIIYCGFVARIINTNKVLYFAKFPPAQSTCSPNLSVESSDEEIKSDIVTKKTMINFINSTDIYQIDGSWKGGKWGSNNFTITSNTWLPQLWIGDKFILNKIKNGIIKFKPEHFNDNDIIIENTENSAWSCNITWYNRIYSVYVTDQVMEQHATDTLFCWSQKENLDELKIKLAQRNYGPNVDCPGKIIPCAGEHIQPEQPKNIRELALIAINEEIGLPKKTISECYLIPLGIYDDDGRDPRYWTYSMLQNKKIITCGVERKSTAVASILYIESDTMPTEISYTDKEEIKKKWWSKYNSLSNYSEELWMLKSHFEFFNDLKPTIRKFKLLKNEEKLKLKL